MIIARVVRGKGNGKKVLGFPTANSVVSDKEHSYIVGKEGAWYSMVYIKPKPDLDCGTDIQSYKAVCGISKKANEYIIETHILDFNEDIYDQDISIKLRYKIRDVIVFKSLDESKEQIKKDIKFVRNYKTCNNCQFCVFQDHGYSNYTIEGTNIYCLVERFNEHENGYNDNELGQATNCIYFNKGEHWRLDVDGETEGPSEDWIKSEIRDIKIRNIIE